MMLLLVLAFQDPPAVEPAKVDAALRRGVAWLQTNGAIPSAPGDQLKPSPDPLGVKNGFACRELVLFAMWHAGVRESDPFFAAAFRTMLEEPPAFTYRTALQAMLLEAMDPAKYRDRILDCAQVLVDNQCANGQWSYGTMTAPEVASPAAKKPAATKGAKPSVVKRRDGPKIGDNSNSQVAALGLRACRDAGIELPRAVLERADAHWRTFRVGKAWNYGPGGPFHFRWVTGSMTAGAAGSLVVYDHLLDRDWSKDEEVAGAIAWLNDHWSVTANPRPTEGDPSSTVPDNSLYYLYGIERLGRLSGCDRLGAHDWYAEGAKAILDRQNSDGSWSWWPAQVGAGGKLLPFADTCFAILFLTRGTKGLVPSTDLKKN